VRLRIRELHEYLGIQFPIYLLFTKCDLLVGFTEFFADLNKQEREQVWGMTFPIGDESTGYAKLFRDGFEQLERRLNDRLVERLQLERDALRRTLIYGFPQQFASIKVAAQRFLEDTFEATRYEIPATLRGVYFTSGTQEGTPLDRLTASLATSFGLSQKALSPFSGPGKSYFVTQLLRDVVFNEAGLANTDLKWEHRRLWLQRAVWGGAIGFAGLILLAWTAGYFKNQSFLEEMTKQASAAKSMVDDIPSSDIRLETTLTALNAIRFLPAGYQSQRSIFDSFTQLGLDQTANLGGEAIVVYRNLLRNLFLPRLMLRIEDRLREENASLDRLYSSLRVYLMLGIPDRFEVADVRGWLENDLENYSKDTLSRQQRSQLLAHFDVLFERGPVDLPLDQDAGLVGSVRAKLMSMSMADRIYANIMDDSQNWRDIADFRAVNHVGNVFNYVFVADKGGTLDAGVDRRYTLEGFRIFKDKIDEVTAKLAGESWILGEGFQPMAEDSNIEKVRNLVMDRYFKDYQTRWENYLDSLTIAPLDNDINKAIDVIHILGSDNSPLKNLLVVVERETTLSRGADLSEKAGRAGSDLFGWAKEKTSNLWDTPAPTTAVTDGQQDINPVDRHFRKLNALVRSGDDNPAPIGETLGLLVELEGFLKTVQKMRGSELVDQVKALEDSVVGRMEIHSLRQPRYLQKWLDVISWQISRTLGDRALAFLNTEWRSTVWQDYQQGLKGKYPLSGNSTQDSTIEDFGEFFGPQGSLEQFFDKYLQDLVDTSGRVWHLQKNSPIHLSRETLIALQRASVIRKAFFPTQDKMPLVSFTLKPISMEVSIDDFTMDLDGQILNYDHSATKVKKNFNGQVSGGQERSGCVFPPPR
jgi:type VI secretion system protein ImpL